MIILYCNVSGWGTKRDCVLKTEFPDAVASMVNEARALRALAGVTSTTDDWIITLQPTVLHADNDSMFRCEKYQKLMGTLGVHLHFAVQYEARTNPYAERFSGVIIPMARALQLEGCYPSKFWPVTTALAVWLHNRIVRSCGHAPLELFAPSVNIDFSSVWPTGTLAYWPMPKKNRNDPKLGSNGVGVYLGPADMVHQAGHLVLTPTGRIFCVAHVRVDTTVRPFERGLRTQMLSKTDKLLQVNSIIDLSNAVFPDGVTAGSLLEHEFQEYFPGYGEPFTGRVVELH
jgi:hypothetical protein